MASSFLITRGQNRSRGAENQGTKFVVERTREVLGRASLMNFRVVPLSEIYLMCRMLVTTAMATILKRRRNGVREVCVVGRNVVSLLVSQPSEVAVNTRQRVSCSTVSVTDVVRW